MITWKIEVFMPEHNKAPIKVGYVEQPTIADAHVIAWNSLDRERYSGARLEISHFSVAPKDNVFWAL